MGRIQELLFPDGGRSFSGQRALKITIRAVHTLCAGVLTGSYLLNSGEEAQSLWLLWTVGTGLGMLSLDLIESVAFLAQVRGVVLMIKIAVLLALPIFGAATGPLLAILMVVAVISSHAPSRVRYAVIFGRGKIRGAETKG